MIRIAAIGDVHVASGPEPQTLSTMSLVEVQARRS